MNTTVSSMSLCSYNSGIFIVITFWPFLSSFLRSMESISVEKVENMKHSHWIALYLRRKLLCKELHLPFPFKF